MRISIACRLLLLLVLAGTASLLIAAEPPLLLRDPTMNRTSIVFCYASDLWSVPREGGEARRLTTGPGIEANPYFSPDGTQIAFTGEYDGNIDVYVMPAAGGMPRRLTWHPEADEVAGWTPDGKRILFVSHRASGTDANQLFTMPLDGGFPEALPLPDCAGGLLFARRHAPGLRPALPVAGCMEALPRRPDSQDLDRRSFKLLSVGNPAPELQRL